MDLLQRRRFLMTLSAGATLALPGWALAENKLWMPEDLEVTPEQVEGPYYPKPTIEQQLYNDTNLLRKLDKHKRAKGQAIVLDGIIKNQKGKPLKGTEVEIWQACSDGYYNHPRDKRNEAKLDKNFQYWGRAVTGEDGKYEFITVIPGQYPGRTARHIHFRVDADGYRRCTTQCYFATYGEDNQRDGLYLRLDKTGREQVTLELDKTPKKKKTKTQSEKPAKKIEEPWRCSFDIVLGK